jgi:NADH:ubiquinone oxidoreductase subunit 5 (subunit L)/multisubunit Na+/H+ antiporter MnhA subunit
MWVPLAVLAVLATIGGFLGISPAFTGGKHVGGKMNIVNWLEPVLWNPVTKGFGEAGGEAEGVRQKAEGSSSTLTASSEPGAARGETHNGAENSEAIAPFGDTGFNLARSIEKSLGESATEWLFIIISLIVAAIGIGLGLLFYVKNPKLPDVWAARLRPLYRASFNKYWVDELYGKLFTRRTMDAARAVYTVDSRAIDGAVNGSAWLTRTMSKIVGGFDKYIVDGLVNGVANFIGRLMSNVFRAAQTGLAANYALVMVLGLVVAVALFFGKDILSAVGILKQ